MRTGNHCPGRIGHGQKIQLQFLDDGRRQDQDRVGVIGCDRRRQTGIAGQHFCFDQGVLLLTVHFIGQSLKRPIGFIHHRIVDIAGKLPDRHAER